MGVGEVTELALETERLSTSCGYVVLLPVVLILFIPSLGPQNYQVALSAELTEQCWLHLGSVSSLYVCTRGSTCHHTVGYARHERASDKPDFIAERSVTCDHAQTRWPLHSAQGH